jgi:hypothetical protein
MTAREPRPNTFAISKLVISIHPPHIQNLRYVEDSGYIDICQYVRVEMVEVQSKITDLQ